MTLTDVVTGDVDPNNPTQVDHHFTYTDLGAVLWILNAVLDRSRLQLPSLSQVRRLITRQRDWWATIAHGERLTGSNGQ